MIDMNKIDVIAPNFKKRMSGVTSTVIRLVPLQAQEIGIVSTGPKLPAELPQIPMPALLTMPRRGPSGYRVWHARRNSEMLPGIVLKYLFRKKLKLLFTSAAQRRHSGYTRWLLRRMDAIIATSSRSASYLEHEATVIPHGIDTDQFHPVEDKTAVRTELGLPIHGKLVGCFGRIRPQKGCDLFVDMMIRLLPKHPDVTAIMMGGVTEQFRDFVKEQQEKIDAAGLRERLLILPEAPDFQITQYFQALDLYIAPQRWEGFGLTPLEAMACAVPVVATRAGAFEDLILDGETGHLCDIEDLDALTAGADDLLSDNFKRQAWSTACLARATQNFQLSKEAQAITAIYRRLLSDT